MKHFDCSATPEEEARRSVPDAEDFRAFSLASVQGIPLMRNLAKAQSEPVRWPASRDVPKTARLTCLLSSVNAVND